MRINGTISSIVSDTTNTGRSRTLLSLDIENRYTDKKGIAVTRTTTVPMEAYDNVSKTVGKHKIGDTISVRCRFWTPRVMRGATTVYPVRIIVEGLDTGSADTLHLEGRLTRKVTVKKTKGGYDRVFVALAANRTYTKGGQPITETNYIPIEAYGVAAHTLAAHAQGDLVHVVCRLQSNTEGSELPYRITCFAVQTPQAANMDEPDMEDEVAQEEPDTEDTSVYEDAECDEEEIVYSATGPF